MADAVRTEAAFAVRGKMGRLIRAHDWASTPLGPVEAWPQALTTLVEVMLGSAEPMFVVWGREQTLIYNDAVMPILGIRHPSALSGGVLDVWNDIREDLSSLVQQVLGGEPIQLENFSVSLERDGYREEATLSFSFTPVRGPGGSVDGFFCAFTDTSRLVFAERQLREHLAVQELNWNLSPDLICVMDIPTIRLERVNPAWTTTLGWSKEELEGKALRGLRSS